MKTIILTLVTLAFIGLNIANAQVGIGTTNPDASAALEIDSKDKGLLPPRMNSSERDAITSPAEGLTIYNTDIRCLDTYNGVRWISCNTIGATDVYNPETGQVWMDRNLGATQVATSSTDPNAYGHFYQWGRGADGHQLRSLDCTTPDCFNASGDNNNLPPTAADVTNTPWDGKFIVNMVLPPADWHQDNPDNTLWQGVNGTNNPCPAGYRIPTEAELDAERLSWDTNNAAGAFTSPLKLTVAGGRRAGDGALIAVNNVGGYWSSTVSGNNARYLVFDNFSTNAIVNTLFRASGFSIRCIKD